MSFKWSMEVKEIWLALMFLSNPIAWKRLPLCIHSALKPNIGVIWNQNIQQIAFDGAWIDMNEPAAFGTNELNPFYFDNDNHPNLKPLSCPLTGSVSSWLIYFDKISLFAFVDLQLEFLKVNFQSGPDSEWDAPPYKTQAVYNFGKVRYSLPCLAE